MGPLGDRNRQLARKTGCPSSIEVDVEYANQHVVRKRFKGRMLVSDFGGFNAAQGECGGIAVWFERDGDPARAFFTYDSWAALAATAPSGLIRDEQWTEDFLSVVAAELGVDYAEEIEL